MDEGVGDLVAGKVENEVEGEGMVHKLVSLDARLRLAAVSYGFSRFLV